MRAYRNIVKSLLWLPIALLASQAAVAQGERVGVAAAVRGYVFKSATPGQLGQRLRSGQPVFEGERITTGTSGRMQLLLTDQTVFTMGPRSSMVMDEYRFNPQDDDKGSVVANFVTGVFRFLTGKVAAKRPSSMRMRANTVATIGIRGTQGIVEVVPQNPIPIIEFPNGAGNIQDNLPIQPLGDVPAQSITTALTGGGTNDFGDPIGSILVSSDVPGGPPPQTVNNDDFALVLDASGNLQLIPALDFINRIQSQLNLPPAEVVVPGGGDQSADAGGSDASRAASQADFLFAGGPMTDEAVNSLAQNVGVFGSLLTPSNFAPGTIISLPGAATGTLVQNNGGNGTFSIGNFSFNTSTLQGSFGLINFLPFNSTTVTGGSALFNIASQTTPIAGSGLPISGLSPSGALANITVFQVQNISSEGSVATPHLVVGVDFVDTISNVVGVGSTRKQLQ